MARWLQPLNIPEHKWQEIGIDFIAAFPKTDDGYDVIMIVVDRATKMVHLVPTTENAISSDVANLFVKNIWRLHGVPRSITSDRDPRFVSLFWRTLMNTLGTKLRMSTAFHPQIDG